MTGPPTTRVDVVAAVRDEEALIDEFVDRLLGLELPADVELGIIFVEDSSRDATVVRLREAARRDPRVRYFALDGSFGQGPALVFGLSRSDADASITMDADGSHPPELVPALIEAHRGGADVVQAVRRRHGGREAYRDLGTALFPILGRLLAGVALERQNVHFRLLSATQRDRVLGHPAWWGILRLRLDSTKVHHVSFDAPARTVGRSKYGPWRLVRLSLEGAVSLMSPRRFGAVVASLGIVAVASAMAGVAGVAVLSAVLAGVLGLVRARLPRAELLERMRVRESSAGAAG